MVQWLGLSAFIGGAWVQSLVRKLRSCKPKKNRRRNKQQKNFKASDTKSKSKNKQIGSHQTKTLLHSKGNHQQNEKTTHRMGENICKLGN